MKKIITILILLVLALALPAHSEEWGDLMDHYDSVLREKIDDVSQKIKTNSKGLDENLEKHVKKAGGLKKAIKKTLPSLFDNNGGGDKPLFRLPFDIAIKNQAIKHGLYATELYKKGDKYEILLRQGADKVYNVKVDRIYKNTTPNKDAALDVEPINDRIAKLKYTTPFFIMEGYVHKLKRSH